MRGIIVSIRISVRLKDYPFIGSENNSVSHRVYILVYAVKIVYTRFTRKLPHLTEHERRAGRIIVVYAITRRFRADIARAVQLFVVHV